MVEHRYSQSAGRASPLKAYYVERNRLFVALKTFPAPLLLRAPLATLARYFWHAAALVRGRGSAAEFHREKRNPLALPWIALKAHLALLRHAPRLWRERRRIRAGAKLSAREFAGLLRAHSISPRQVAAL